MFNKKTLVAAGVVLLILVNIIALSVSSRSGDPFSGPTSLLISIAGPFQEATASTARFLKGIWKHYFFLVSVAKTNDRLRRKVGLAAERNNRCNEVALANERLRDLLAFKRSSRGEVLPAEVIGKDPSPWFKSVLIDKGRAEGVREGLPVVVPDGVAGMVTDVSAHYAKVLLIIDQNSAVDVLVQPTRVRGVLKGRSAKGCTMEYALRKHHIEVGATIVSSGLDGVFPKGLRVGEVTDVERKNAGIFQEVTVDPYVDFERLEEVLVVLGPPTPPGGGGP